MPLPNVDKQRLLVRAAVMYYAEGKTQLEIARHLGVSRATAGRLVAQARAAGIVRIEIVSGITRQVETELALESAYGLEEVVVVDPADTDGAGNVDLGQGCADILARRLEPGNVIGLGWSSNPNEWIARTAEVLRTLRRSAEEVLDVTVVQLAGAAPSDPTRVNPMRTVSAVADALGAHEILVAAPLYVDNAATVASLRADRGISTAFETAARADICMFGVGHVTPTTPLFANGYLDEASLRRLQEQGAVGDAVGRFFDASGRPIGGELADRTLSVDLDEIRTRPLRVAAAAGPERVQALRAALSGGLANAVVTDTPTAQALLDAAPGRRPEPPSPHPGRTTP
ncbi:sugar-binding transcriptional regulator [Pseudonocardia sichuanensis]|uniref:Deoxyribonucleoside regulator n=1 Tax=Pseudonocardia kunmingensis TaxID=630975 RepID=A0A543DRE7_9PSEU|nr:sugar-binding transcriptional regulator [Pseudonocardia kunmingensis]TQM11893.1 deoxyribonucleoside regulator [Pseudonocardia kunmingensis]